MKMFNRLPLSKKLAFSTVLMIGTSLIFLTALIYLSLLSFGESFLRAELNERNSIVQESFSGPLWNFDNIQVQQVGNAMFLDCDYFYVSALKVEDPSGKVLFERDTLQKKTDFSTVTQRPYTQASVIKLVREGQHIGTVSLAITNEGFIKTIRGQLFRILALSLAVLCLVSLALKFYFQKILTDPLNQILAQVHKLESNKYRPVGYVDLPPELEVIANGLDKAWSLAKKRNEDVLSYADNLEQLVNERTAELEGQIAKNINAARLVAVGEMAANVAHEINNPLTIIDLHISRLRKLGNSDVPINPGEVLNTVEKVNAMISRIAKIIRGLKSLARDGHSDPMQNFQVAPMLEEIKVLVDMKIKSQDIFFKTEFEHPALEIVGREVQVSQVLVNLINNSVDAIATLPEKWITLKIETSDDFVIFTVTDSGKGIPVELQEKIMTPFFTTKDSHRGTGLGLSITKKIIEEHGGYFQYNKHSENTQFVFTLKKAIVTKLSA